MRPDRDLPLNVPSGTPLADARYWASKRVLVTGGSGFLGSRVVAQLQELDAHDVFVPRRAEYDLTEQRVVRRLFAQVRPDVVIHLAGEVGGIGANRQNPGRFFYANAVMGLHVIEESRRRGVGKFVQTGTICAYPKYTPIPFRESDLWAGYPEETNAPYGLAKKALLVQIQAYRAQYAFPGIYLLPVNLYGPRDNFDPASSHVIPALIRRFVEARDEGAPAVALWGTGAATREFLYADDCARGILSAAERYDGDEPVNLGTGREVRILDLARMIAALVGFTGEIGFDPSQPDGQPRRCVDTTRAWREFGFRASTSLEDGLAHTVRWYEERRAVAPAVA
jgi:GDP-L-fucose synthase